jgi:hypothetical protein
LGNEYPVAGDQGFLLSTAPALELSFREEGIVAARRSIRPDQFDRPAFRRVAAERALLVLGEAIVDVVVWPA